MRSLLLPLLFALTVACGGKTPAELTTEAQAAFDGGDAAKALTLADAALATDAVKKDAPSAWRLEQIKLEALAKGGKGADVLANLERLAGTNPKQVNAALYRALADKVKAADDTPGAIDILAAGDKRFPADHATFQEAIDALKNSGNLDPAEVERLKALGYL